MAGSGGSGRDWVFISFVAFAVGMTTWVGVKRVRLNRAIERTSSCLAVADTACTEAALDDARGIDADNVRVRIAAADAKVLLGEVSKASGELVALDQQEGDLEPRAHGELLLAKGDLAAAQGARGRARDLFTKAQGLVNDDGLVQPRLNRLSDADQQHESELQALHDKVADVITAAEQGQTDTVALRKRDVMAQIEALSSPIAKQKLTLALSGAERAAALEKSANTDPTRGFSIPLVAPTRPDPGAFSDSRMYQAQLANYNRQLQFYQTMQSSQQARQQERVSSLTALANENLTQARQLLAEAMTMLSNAPDPAK